MEDYKPNSHKFREEQKDSQRKVEKVVTGAVKTRKKSEVRKFTDIFVSEDIANVKSYIFMDVLIPAVKKAISDVVTNGIDMLLYGESRRDTKRAGDYVSYRNYSDRGATRSEPRARSGFNFDDLLFKTRADAEAVREQMDDMIDRYGVVTVADLYDMADCTAPYTSNKYGWTNIRNADVVRGRDGYVIKLPRAMPID